MKGLCTFLVLIGRICLSLVFIWDGFYKIFEFQSSVQRLQELAGVSSTVATWITIVSLVVEVIFGVALIVGWLSRFSALVLAIYTLCIIVLLHPFWTMQGDDRAVELMNFLAGVGIIGGLFYVMGCGGGCCSCDARACKKL